MDWNDFRYFLAVVRAGTLAGAGRQLGVEHTTVARRIAALEAALGVRLFVRGPDGFTPTDAAREMVPIVESIAERFESIARLASRGDERVAGTVRLTIPESGNAYFVQQLSALRAQHPELRIEILSDNRALDIRRGEADVGVRLRDNTDPDLLVRKVGVVGWSLYASPAYLARKGPLASPEDLGGHDVIGFDASLSEIVGATWLRAHAGEANVVLRGNSIAAVSAAVEVGIGIGALPCFVAVQTPSLVRLTPALIGSRDIVLVVHPDLARVARVRVTLDFLIELFARDAALWRGTA